MIKIDRSRVSAPSALIDKEGAGPLERTANIEGFAAFSPDPNRHKPKKKGKGKKNTANTQPQFEFTFEAYRRRDVRETLTSLFFGKCAYCEHRFAATQPVDVEHWRPKGRVKREDGVSIQGYYWLAADWDNLLPSCIDCNRARAQRTPLGTKLETLGKKDQFPVWNEALRWTNPGEPNQEVPLLLHPYFDDPTEVLAYSDEGVTRPRPEAAQPPPGPTRKERGEQSIRVYALNRVELVNERRALVKRIERIKLTVTRLMQVLAALRKLHNHERAFGEELIEQVLDQELEQLARLMEPASEFSALARERIEGFLSLLERKTA